MKPKEKNPLKIIFLILTLVTGFIFITAFSVYYVSDAINKGNVCGCAVPIPLMLVILSSLGVFVGSGIYYLIYPKLTKSKEKPFPYLKAVLKFLEPDERMIIQLIIDSSQTLTQSQIAQETNFDKVKISRLIKKLEEKEIISKNNEGKTNKISLADDLKALFR